METDRAVNRTGCFVRPRGLQPLDRVAVVAPAGPFDRESFDAGLRVIAERYRPVFAESLFARTRYLAGDDARRLDELNAALADDSIKAVFAARGGYGSMRLLPKLRVAGLTPKPVIGFSDITALHLALQSAGWISVYGPVTTQLGTQPREVVERLFHLLESTVSPTPALAGTPLVGGLADGPLVGGNLSVLTRLLGTPYLPTLEGAVLLLEDVGERPYRLDRMWTHLALAGVWEQVRGIVLGEFIDCEEPDENDGSATVLAALAAETGLPCVSGLPIGHGVVNAPVPLGCRVQLDGSAGTLAFLEAAVAPADLA
ncbi:MAG: S66 peptidase family protein [Candidatus Rokuibacteriota bacterium]